MGSGTVLKTCTAKRFWHVWWMLGVSSALCIDGNRIPAQGQWRMPEGGELGSDPVSTYARQLASNTLEPVLCAPGSIAELFTRDVSNCTSKIKKLLATSTLATLPHRWPRANPATVVILA